MRSLSLSSCHITYIMSGLLWNKSLTNTFNIWMKIWPVGFIPLIIWMSDESHKVLPWPAHNSERVFLRLQMRSFLFPIIIPYKQFDLGNIALPLIKDTHDNTWMSLLCFMQLLTWYMIKIIVWQGLWKINCVKYRFYL